MQSDIRLRFKIVIVKPIVATTSSTSTNVNLWESQLQIWLLILQIPLFDRVLCIFLLFFSFFLRYSFQKELFSLKLFLTTLYSTYLSKDLIFLSNSLSLFCYFQFILFIKKINQIFYVFFSCYYYYYFFLICGVVRDDS